MRALLLRGGSLIYSTFLLLMKRINSRLLAYLAAGYADLIEPCMYLSAIGALKYMSGKTSFFNEELGRGVKHYRRRNALFYLTNDASAHLRKKQPFCEDGFISAFRAIDQLIDSRRRSGRVKDCDWRDAINGAKTKIATLLSLSGLDHVEIQFGECPQGDELVSRRVVATPVTQSFSRSNDWRRQLRRALPGVPDRV